MRDFFKGLKVVELASVLAGPAVGTFFAELGAEVTKVENKRTKGDVTRGWRVTGESESGTSAYYASVNYGKNVLMADLTDKQDIAEISNLVKEADLIISNFQPRVAKKFKLDYQTVQNENPKVIFLDLKGYENQERPAYDVVLQAETGWISMTGTDSDNPAKLPVALIDVLAGHQLKEAALLALLHRERTGEGSYTICSLEAASLAALANQASNYLMAGKVAQPIGTAHPNIAPYGDWFETKDGVRFVLAIGSEKHFGQLTKVLNLANIFADTRFRTNSSRVQNRIKLNEILRGAIAQFDFSDLSQKMNEEGIPFGEIKGLDLVLDGETARQLTLEENQEGTATTRLSGIAFKTSF
ncbi:CoA transferase [Cryomorphaceae bacterium 1068]|nr:CoA transferase [Cryomorphaceae bacterium 1068]